MMAALYFTWTGWTQGPPERHTFSLRDTFFMHARCAFHTRGPWKHLPITPTRRADSQNWILTRNYSCRRLWHSASETGGVPGCTGLDVQPLLNKGTRSIVASPGEQNKSSELWAAEFKETIAFECHRRDKRRLSSSVQGAVSVLQHPHAHTHPHYNLFTSWKYMGSHTGGGVWSSNLCS